MNEIINKAWLAFFKEHLASKISYASQNYELTKLVFRHAYTLGFEAKKLKIKKPKNKTQKTQN